MLRKIIAILISFCFFFEQTGFAQVTGPLVLPAFMAGPACADTFRPEHLRAVAFNPGENDFRVILDKGTAREKDPLKLGNSTRQLFNYFLTGLSLPNDSFWVNLRPDSPDNIIDEYLSRTDLGKVMLEADVQLKKDTARYTSPDTSEGKVYWDKLYSRAQELFGNDNITVPTLTRPWIVPDEIILRQSKDNVYIYKATLKVMLESDYLKDSAEYALNDPRLKELNDYSSQLIRESILPKLTRDVNISQRYASLRQVYFSLILAQWFKNKVTRSQGYDLLSSKIDSRDLSGLNSKIPWTKDTYFRQYQKSFKNGEYNKQENVQTAYGVNLRQYFSGGVRFAGILDAVAPGNAIAANPLAGVLPGNSAEEVVKIAQDDPFVIEDIQTGARHPGDLPIVGNPSPPIAGAPVLNSQDGGVDFLMDMSQYPSGTSYKRKNREIYMSERGALEGYIRAQLEANSSALGIKATSGEKVKAIEVSYKESGSYKDIFAVQVLLSTGRRLKLCLAALQPFGPGDSVAFQRGGLGHFKEEFEAKLQYIRKAPGSGLRPDAVPAVYANDVFRSGGLCCYLQEWIDGRTVDEVMSSRPLTKDELERIAYAWMSVISVLGKYVLDPFGGNMMMRSDGSLAAVDLGAMRTMRSGAQSEIIQMLFMDYDPWKMPDVLHSLSVSGAEPLATGDIRRALLSGMKKELGAREWDKFAGSALADSGDLSGDEIEAIESFQRDGVKQEEVKVLLEDFIRAHDAGKNVYSSLTVFKKESVRLSRSIPVDFTPEYKRTIFRGQPELAGQFPGLTRMDLVAGIVEELLSNSRDAIESADGRINLVFALDTEEGRDVLRITVIDNGLGRNAANTAEKRRRWNALGGEGKALKNIRSMLSAAGLKAPLILDTSASPTRAVVTIPLEFLQEKKYDQGLPPIAQDGGGQAQEDILEKLRRGNPIERGEAAGVLARKPDPAAFEVLLSALTGDPDDYVRALAAAALGKLNDRLTEEQRLQAAVGLIAALRAPGSFARSSAVQALAALNYSPASPEIGKLLKDNDPAVRSAAAAALGGLKYSAGLDALIAALGDEDIAVKKAAASALGSIGDEQAVPALLDTFRSARRDNQGKDIQSVVLKALSGFKDARAQKLLYQEINNGDPDVGGTARAILGAMPASRVAGWLLFLAGEGMIRFLSPDQVRLLDEFNRARDIVEQILAQGNITLPYSGDKIYLIIETLKELEGKDVPPGQLRGIILKNIEQLYQKAKLLPSIGTEIEVWDNMIRKPYFSGTEAAMLSAALDIRRGNDGRIEFAFPPTSDYRGQAAMVDFMKRIGLISEGIFPLHVSLGLADTYFSEPANLQEVNKYFIYPLSLVYSPDIRLLGANKGQENDYQEVSRRTVPLPGAGIQNDVENAALRLEARPFSLVNDNVPGHSQGRIALPADTDHFGSLLEDFQYLGLLLRDRDIKLKPENGELRAARAEYQDKIRKFYDKYSVYSLSGLVGKEHPDELTAQRLVEIRNNLRFQEELKGIITDTVDGLRGILSFSGEDGPAEPVLKGVGLSARIAETGEDDLPRKEKFPEYKQLVDTAVFIFGSYQGYLNAAGLEEKNFFDKIAPGFKTENSGWEQNFAEFKKHINLIPRITGFTADLHPELFQEVFPGMSREQVRAFCGVGLGSRPEEYGKIKFVALNLTQGCSNQCLICGVRGWQKHKLSRQMPFPIAVKIMQKISGEMTGLMPYRDSDPLDYYDEVCGATIADIVSAAKTMDFANISILTHGTNLHKDRLPEVFGSLSRNTPLSSLGISFHVYHAGVLAYAIAAQDPGKDKLELSRRRDEIVGRYTDRFVSMLRSLDPARGARIRIFNAKFLIGYIEDYVLADDSPRKLNDSEKRSIRNALAVMKEMQSVQDEVWENVRKKFPIVFPVYTAANPVLWIGGAAQLLKRSGIPEDIIVKIQEAASQKKNLSPNAFEPVIETDGSLVIAASEDREMAIRRVKEVFKDPHSREFGLFVELARAMVIAGNEPRAQFQGPVIESADLKRLVLEDLKGFLKKAKVDFTGISIDDLQVHHRYFAGLNSFLTLGFPRAKAALTALEAGKTLDEQAEDELYQALRDLPFPVKTEFYVTFDHPDKFGDLRFLTDEGELTQYKFQYSFGADESVLKRDIYQPYRMFRLDPWRAFSGPGEKDGGKNSDEAAASSVNRFISVLRSFKDSLRNGEVGNDAASVEERGKARSEVIRIGSPAVKYLLPHLQDRDNKIRAQVAFLLARAGKTEAVGPLIGLIINEEDSMVVNAALEGLISIGEPAVRPLTGLLKHENPLIYRYAAAYLGKIGSKTAVEPLIACLQSHDEGMICNAAMALAGINDPGGMKALEEFIKTAEKTKVKYITDDELVKLKVRIEGLREMNEIMSARNSSKGGSAIAPKDGGVEFTLDLSLCPARERYRQKNIAEYKIQQDALKGYILKQIKEYSRQLGLDSPASGQVQSISVAYANDSGKYKDIFKVIVSLSAGKSFSLCLAILKPYQYNIFSSFEPVSVQDINEFQSEAEVKCDFALKAKAAGLAVNAVPEMYDTGVSRSGPLRYYLQEWIEGPTVAGIMGTRPLTGGELERIAQTWMAVGRLSGRFAGDSKGENMMMRRDGSFVIVDLGGMLALNSPTLNERQVIYDLFRVYDQQMRPAILKSLSDKGSAPLETSAARRAILTGMKKGLGPGKWEEFIGNALASKLIPDERQAIESFLRSGGQEARSADGGAVTAPGRTDDLRAINLLIGAFGDKDHSVKANAREALRGSGAIAVQPLIQALDGKDRDIRYWAAETLGDMRYPGVFEALVRVLDRDDESVSVYSAAAVALGTLRDPRAFEHLSLIMKGKWKSKDLRYSAAYALGLLGDTRAVPVLIAALEDYAIRGQAIPALGNLKDPRSVEPLIGMLKISQGGMAAASLSKFQAADVIEPLVRAIDKDIQNDLGQPSWEFREHAACVLGELKDERGIGPLIRLLGKSKNYRALVAIENALMKFGPLAVEPLIAALNDRNEDIREKSADILGRIGDRRAIEPLRKSLDSDRDKIVRRSAAIALGKFKDDRAIPSLVKLLGSPGIWHGSVGEALVDVTGRKDFKKAAVFIDQIYDTGRMSGLNQPYLTRKVNSLLGAYRRGEIGSGKFLDLLEELYIRTMSRSLLAVFGDMSTKNGLGNFLKSDPSRGEALWSLSGAYLDIRSKYPFTAGRYETALRKMIEIENAAEFNRWLYTGSEWNRDVYRGLLRAGYKPGLWAEGISKTVRADPGSIDAREELRKQTFQLIELARRNDVKFDDAIEALSSYDEAKAFVREYLRDVKSIDQENVDGILEETNRLEKRYAETAMYQPRDVTVEIGFDFLKTSGAGKNVPGCFNPLTGSERKMPLVHALEANALFLRIYNGGGNMLANAVLFLTDNGVQVQPLYNAGGVNLDKAVLDALAELLEKGLVPAVLLDEHSAGISVVRGYAFRDDLASVKKQDRYEKYYADQGKQQEGEEIVFSTGYRLTRESLRENGYVPLPPVSNQVQSGAKKDNARREAKKRIGRELYAYCAAEGLEHVNLSPVMQSLEGLLTGTKDISAVTVVLTARGAGKPVTDGEKEKIGSKLADLISHYGYRSTGGTEQKDGGGTAPGGIDLRRLPVNAGTQVTLPERVRANAGGDTRLDAQWQEIQELVNKGFLPESGRIKEYLSACRSGKRLPCRVDKVLAGAADILRIEEDMYLPTDASLKELLVLLESN